jgi:hypothetical protein
MDRFLHLPLSFIRLFLNFMMIGASSATSDPQGVDASPGWDPNGG